MKMFLVSIFAMTMVLYLDKFLFMAEMIVNRGVSSMELFMMMVYISPAFLAITIPMAVLMASVVTFNQFSANNEWVAMKACNMSFMQLMKPVLFFSLFPLFLKSQPHLCRLHFRAVLNLGFHGTIRSPSIDLFSYFSSLAIPRIPLAGPYRSSHAMLRRIISRLCRQSI